jgi:hypothetical protein
VRFVPRSTLVTVMAVPGMTAPDESLIVPKMLPSVDWALLGRSKRENKQDANNTRKMDVREAEVQIMGDAPDCLVPEISRPKD